METETLRAEFQNLVPHGETPRLETLEPPSSQLKQEPTVNHHHPQTKQDAPTQPTPTAAQVPSPGSDDPTTEMEDVSDSLQDPKPSSASTDPAAQMQTPKAKFKQLPCNIVCTPSVQPQVAVEKSATLDRDNLPTTRSNTLHPPRPFSFPHEDGFSSDEDEDFCRFYTAMLRRKSDAEMTAPTPPSPVVVEQAKKARNTRQSNGKVQKRRAKETVREIPFSDPKYHKVVGPMVLRPTEIARDLATIYGREYKESVPDNTKASVRPSERKRHRGSDTTTSNGLPHTKRLRQNNANIADTADKKAVLEVGRPTRHAKRNNGHVTSPPSDRGQGGTKRQRTGGFSAGGGDMDQRKMFEKHPDRKGWVVCKKCEAAVWPPNCGKHLFHCRKL